MNCPPHELQSARLRLEPLRLEHADETWQLIDDARMWQYFPALRPRSLQHLRDIYRRRLRGTEGQVWENWICRLRGSGHVIGEMQATIVPQKRSALIAYGVYPTYQRQGYAREAAQAVLDHLRGTHEVHRVNAEMDVRNASSVRLAEALGFARVKTTAKANRLAGTPYGDEYLYELVWS